MWKFTQRAFTGGRLDAELMGRQDLAQYYKGASELMNLVVRRQGHLSKRRGTDFVCDLEGLLGYSIDAETGERVANAIGKCRIFPLVHERERGFYILMTAGRAFLCSRDGVRLMDGSWARKIEEKSPFSVDVPYADSELEDIDFCQSGDTVFLAHRGHPPAKIVYDGSRITYLRLDFSYSTWKRPAIVSVEKTGVDSGVSGAGTRTVSYVCTYVKNGIESMPSEPFEVSYQTPWKSGGVMTITCSRGDNATEPDYYNIYKKDFTEYGLIFTVGAPQEVSPDVSAEAVSGTMSSQVKATLTYTQVNVSKPKTITRTRAGWGVERFLNVIYTNLDSGEAMLYENDGFGMVACLPLIGGMQSPGGVRFNLGGKSGGIVTRMELQLDNYSGYTISKGYGDYQKPQYIRHHVFGRRFNVKVTAVQNSDPDATTQPTAKTITKTLSVAMPSGVSSTAHSGQYDTDSGMIVQNWQRNQVSWDKVYAFKDIAQKRILDVSFETELVNAFKSESWSNGGKQGYHVQSIEVTAIDDSGNAVSGSFLFCGVKFSSTMASSKIVKDEYITPDLSLTPPQAEVHFGRAGDFPSCVGIYKQRLAFASTDNDPFKFWLSCVGDLYNFNTHASIREDDAISATLAATEFPKINHIIVNRDLMLLADSGEWKVAPISGNTLSYKTVSADMQSAIGSSKSLKPMNVGDEVLFVKRTGETLLATRYNFTSDGYESMDLSVLSQWIFRNNPIVQMAYRQHPDSTIECVLADGTMASLVYMKEHEVCAWSRHELGGGWKARGVATSKAMSRGSTEVMIVVERDGRCELWAMRDDVPVRTSAPAAADHLCMDGMRELGEGEAEGDRMEVIQAGGKRYAGYLYKAEFATVRPEPQGGETIQFEVKNAKDTEVRILDSGDFRVRAYGVPENMATKVATGAKMAEDGSAALATGDFKRVLAGCNNGDGRVVVESETPFPLNILSISVNYEIQPLSGSAG